MSPSRAVAGTLSFLARMPDGYCEHTLAGATRRVVDSVWTSVSTRHEVVLIEPDGCVDVIVRTSAVADTRSRRPSAVVVGAMTRARAVTVCEGDVHLGVRFRPGQAYSALGVALDQLTDTVHPLHRLALTPAQRRGMLQRGRLIPTPRTDRRPRRQHEPIVMRGEFTLKVLRQIQAS
jgi:hypothetical protein